jgi:lactoylglutathione lyase
MARVSLMVIYTENVQEVCAAYTALGLTFVQEQHGNGPAHFAATLADGMVIEIYSGTRQSRLQLEVPSIDDALKKLAHFGIQMSRLRVDREQTIVLATDPDGRSIELVEPTPRT